MTTSWSDLRKSSGLSWMSMSGMQGMSGERGSKLPGFTPSGLVKSGRMFSLGLSGTEVVRSFPRSR